MENFGAIMLACIIKMLPLTICLITNTDNNFFLMSSLIWAIAWYLLIAFFHKNKAL